MTSAPRVSAGVEVRRDNRVVRSTPSTLIAADPDGRLVRFVGLGLDGLDEGAYELRLGVQDQTNGARLERVEPFVLARETSSP